MPKPDIAERLMDHVYAGLCPDPVYGWEQRDPECAACRALGNVEIGSKHVEQQKIANLISLSESTLLPIDVRQRAAERALDMLDEPVDVEGGGKR